MGGSCNRGIVTSHDQPTCRPSEEAAATGPTLKTDMIGPKSQSFDHTLQHRHGVAIEIPGVVKREAEALQCMGCTSVLISLFDRTSGIWTITFTEGERRRARLLWALEVDA